MKASTGRRNFPRNSLGLSISKSLLSSKFLGWPIIWRPRSSSSCSSLEDMFWRSNICFTSRTQCLQVTCDLYLHLWFTSWTLVKIQVRTLVKVLLNWTLTIFYTCSAYNYKSDTCNLDLWRILLNSFSSARLNTIVPFVDYKCKSIIKLTPRVIFCRLLVLLHVQ